MKILFILVIISVTAFSQDFEPSQHQFQWDTTSIYLSADSAYFKQKNILLGWHWGGSKKISKSLNADQNDALNYYVQAEDVDSNCNLIVKPREYSHAVDGQVLNARAIQYEPTLELNSIVPDSLIIRQGDKTRPVFGFVTRRGRINTVLSDTNFNRIIIDSVNLINTVILDNPWPQDQLTYTYADTVVKELDGKGNLVDKKIEWLSVTNNYLCRQLYFSINLRRFDNALTNDSVLKIELPYTLIDGVTTDHIQFDTLPRPYNNASDTFSLVNGRGLIRKLQTARCPLNTREFYITKKMLPPHSQNKDITISALFTCDGNTSHNPRLNYSDSFDINPINKLGIRITYMDSTCPLAIDWVRIETPHAQNMLRGEYDTLLTTHVQEDLIKFLDTSFTNRGIRMFRYNTIVEGGLQNWIAEKYFNKLIGNISTCEVGVMYPEHYEYYVNSPDRWLGTYKINCNVSVPYSRKVYPPNDTFYFPTMGLVNGYNGVNNDSVESNPKKSHYETYLMYFYDSVPLNYFLQHPDSILKYEQVMNTGNNFGKGSFLADYEGTIYRNFFKRSSRGFLFSDKFWWNQGFIHLEWFDYPNTVQLNDTNKRTIALLGKRPFTGEEFRLFATQGIIVGAKGLLYDGCETEKGYLKKSQFYDGTCIDDTARKYLELESDHNFLNSELAGTDFLKDTNEILNLNNRLHYLDTIASYLDRPKDRIYVGRKSVRLEMKKLHDWIRANDTTLMKLRLAGWLAKGFREWYIQDDKRFGTDTVLSKFLNADYRKYKTRPIGRDTALIPIKPWHRLPYYENPDSMFFDVTLLRNSADTNISSKEWFVGIQNRRTSCLLQTLDTLLINNALIVDSSLKFYSTAEFDDFVQNGGTTILMTDTGRIWKPASYWQDQFWKRAGCREITIPFNFKYSNDTNQYALLHVTELGYDNPTLNSDNRRQPKYHHMIDTIIGQDRELVVRLLAGEGKILKVEVIPPAEKINGELSYSNQRKLIGYPILDSNGVMVKDSLYYHLTYHKTENGRTKVYYRRSKPVHHDDDTTFDNYKTSNIIWSQEVCISDSILCRDGIDRLNWYSNCKYPAIVVRYDSVINKSRVYIVFTCEGRQPCEPVELIACPNDFVTIVEDIINADDTTQAFNKSQVIAYACGTDYNKWGVSMINASRYGNYYVWSDSLKGITSAWKRPHDSLFNPAFNFTLSSFRWKVNPLESLHPSLNSYSKIHFNESDCAVIWQERILNDTLSPFGIFYSLLTANSTGTVVNHHLTNNIRNINPSYQYKSDETIVKLSYNNENNQFPTVFRNINDTLITTETFDATAFESYRIDSNVICPQGYPMSMDRKNFISTRTLKHLNLYPSSSTSTEIRPRSKVMSLTNSLTKPNLSQGCGILSGSYVGNPKAVLFEFNEEDVCPQNGEHNPRIWQYPHDYLSFTNDSSNYIESDHFLSLATNAKKIHDNARIPQLAARPFMHDYKEWWQNKRVFEYDSSITDIATSSKEFYKNGIINTIAVPMLGYGDSINNSYISPILLNLKKVKIDIGYLFPENNDSLRRYMIFTKRKDTIKTEWFKISSLSDLGFFGLGMFNDEVELKIERKNDRRISALTLSRISNERLQYFNYRLVNGQNNEYRLLFINRNPQNEFNENTVLMLNPFPEVLYKSDNSPCVVDLDGLSENNNNSKNISLSIFPNPTDDNIYATVYLPIEMIKSSSGLILKVYSTLGFELFKQEVKSGETLSIDTRSYPPGAYFIRAEEKIDSFDKLPAVIENFIIQR